MTDTVVSSGTIQSQYNSNMINRAGVDYEEVNNGDIVYVANSVSAANIIINSGGKVDNYAGYTSNIIINSGGVMATYGRDSPIGPWEASSYDVTINYGGVEYVGTNLEQQYGEYSESYNAKVYGSQLVTDRAVASNAVIYSGGSQTVTLQGSTDYTTILNGGNVLVTSGAFASNVNVSSGGSLFISVLASAVDTTINAAGAQYIGSGGHAVNTIISGDGAFQSVMSGGSVNNTSIYDGGNLLIASNAVASNVQIYANGSEIVSNGGSAISTTINAGGVQELYAGGYAQNTILSGLGATQSLSDESTSVVSTVINSGAWVENDEGVTSGVIINSGGTMYTAGREGVAVWNASSYDVIINSGAIEYVGSNFQKKYGSYGKSFNAQIYGSQLVTNRAVASNAIIYSGGCQITTIQGGISGTIISNGGQAIIYAFATDVTVSSGGILTGTGEFWNTIVSNGGSFTVSSGGNLVTSNSYNMSGAITSIASGGHLFVSSGATILGEIQLGDGGFATLDAGVSQASYYSAGTVLYTGGTINLSGNTNGGLTITGLENGGTLVTTITGFDGTDPGNSDIIKIAGVQQKDVKNVEAKGDNVNITLTNNQTINLNIVGAEDTGYSLGTAADGSLTYEVCFLSGSLIKMLDGEQLIEDIRIGDEIMTFDYACNQEVASRVKWVGNKKATVKPWLSDDEAGYPVRIVKDAIAEGIPHQDLLITAEHCLFFDGQFIPVRMLINGSTIFYDRSITEYTYYHIETEQHSVITANGMLTESYLDTGNRHSFKQDGEFVLFSKPLSKKTWEQDSCHPLMVEREVVEPLYHQIKERAVAMGQKFITSQKRLTNDPKLHLITPSGQEIYPFSQINGKYLFNIPIDIEEVYISSRVSRLCDTIGPFIDNRHSLGVEVGDILMMTTNKVYKVTDHLFKSDLSGWHGLEKNAGCRWTKGHAILPLNYKNAFDRVLSLHILSSNSYFLEEENEEMIEKIA